MGIEWKSQEVNYGLIFNSQTEAAKYYNIKITSINNIINGKSKQTRDGKQFRSL